MRTPVAALCALACACGQGLTKGDTPTGLGDAAVHPGSTPPGSSDAGPDGGRPDAGPSDAGAGSCAGNTFNALGVDSCFTQSNVSVFVQSDHASCATTIYLNTVPTCTGSLSGGSDAFDGGCQSAHCTASSLPGTVFCTFDGGNCSLLICNPDAGTCP